MPIRNASQSIDHYVNNISTLYNQGNATEHSYRGDLQQLIESLAPEVRATNEPKRQSCGAPDYILTKKDIPVGFIEAKDVGDKDLEGKKKSVNKEQFDRYKASLNNLIFTDYIDFHLYNDGEFITKIAIAEITEKGVIALPQNFARFENLIKDFCVHVGQTIKSSKKLAEMMAGKARLLSDIIEKSLTSDEENQENSTLKEQMLAFKQILIHDITPQSFADVYAQTIAYGMFAARLHDPTLDNFSRQEAAELIPKSNPFLRKLFGYIAGPDIDDRIKWVVENLSEIFLACNVEDILKNYGKSTKMEDPIIHFYETFLSEYDPKLRKARGVWYTPKPVVNFIVRAVDDILKTEFELPQGLADTSKASIKVDVQGKKVAKEVHRVQILDPATGTGTFLAETIRTIYTKFKGQQGIWSNYVETHLLPRLNGFELLMASYAMAHLKLDLLLTETGFKPTSDQRFRVYLTNSLEKHHQDTGTLFANWLSTEANEANHIKRDTPVMCVIGNPPYAVSSTNKNDWIQDLISDYKKNLNERKINLDDDYIKFIRYGQHYIDKNGSGVLAYISNNSFIDGITHRQMRKHLLETFDKIYILDLHGNAKKKEVCPDGSPDQNVFDIMQGVSINIFVKTDKKKKTELGEVYHFDLQGKRKYKYETLNNSTISEIKWSKLEFKIPYYFFVPKDFESEEKYKSGFKVDELFNEYVAGIETIRDSITIHFNKVELEIVVNDFMNLDEKEIASKYNTKDSRDWKIGRAKDDIKQNYLDTNVRRSINYRPFDIRKTFYTGKQNGFVCNGRFNVMKHLLNDNLGFIAKRGFDEDNSAPTFITKHIIDRRGWSRPGMQGAESTFPLYLFPETNGQLSIGQDTERVPNLNVEIVKKIAEKLGIRFVPEKKAPLLYKEGCPQDGVVKNTTQNLAVKNINNLPHLKTFRKELRNNSTPAEAKLWTLLKGKQLEGRKFRRQFSVANYILDFYCPSENLAIELDGQGHFEALQAQYDTERDLFLEHCGIKVLRFENKWVWDNPEGLLEEVKNNFDWRSTPQSCGQLPSKGEQLNCFAPIDILDYIYAVLHSPSYREQYKEFLKIDFPRVPYPKDKDTFWALVQLGGEIRQIHLLESPKVEDYITTYPKDGDNMITRKITKTNIGYESIDNSKGRVWINDEQFFDNVPLIAWEFYIGGYQPAQKWLKDRKGRALSFEDILHYQKIIVALSETDRLMKEIDSIMKEKDNLKELKNKNSVDIY
ncbi:MAG: type ISP restriction/modification enzyme [Flavobacteriaceae bacterium]